MKTRVMENWKRVFVTAVLAAGLGTLTVGCTTTSGPAVSAEKLAELEAAANKDDADAMMKVGDAYSKNKEYAKAKAWYDKAKAAFAAQKK